MNLFVTDPEWGWWITWYFFLGGIAAGAYFTATLIDLIGNRADHTLARMGYLLAFPLICVCGLLLILDLSHPFRFWHMLFKSEVVHESLEQGWPWSWNAWKNTGSWPTLKYWSPMSIGSWALSLFGFCSLLSVLGSLWPVGRLARLLRWSPLGRILQLLGSATGFFIASYTGALLTATNQPVWSDSVWIAPLFLTSAASTGVAAMIILSRFSLKESRFPGGTEALHRLERADRLSIVLEFGVFTIFLLSLGTLVMPMLQSANGKLLIGGTLMLGFIMPLGLRLARNRSSRGVLTAALSTLLAGFVLRYAILKTPPEMLSRHSTATAAIITDRNADSLIPGFSPEDSRPRGGGFGADPGNRPAELQPRSKVFPTTDHETR